jgi:multidrug efflux system membrane fusion protein
MMLHSGATEHTMTDPTDPQSGPDVVAQEQPGTACNPEGGTRVLSPEASIVKKAAQPVYRRRTFLFIVVVGFLVGVWWGTGYLFAYTDDAYLTSDLISITPEVGGPIASVAVTDNQRVARGRLLFTIDPVPFGLELKQVKAQEAQALAQLPIDQAEYESLQAQSQSADASAKLASMNLDRDSPLGKSGYISAQSLDKTRNALEEAEAQRRAAHAMLRKAAQTLQLHQASVTSAQATRLLSEWRESRTRVVAPVDGYVTHLTLQPGDMAQPGHAVAAIVDAHAWHILANYKEYYLRHLLPGHTAWVWLDAHPWRLYRARIQGIAHGISRGKGGEDLVPYVSPTVNWIRLQRRIPVRLTLIDPPNDAELYMGTDARVLVAY